MSLEITQPWTFAQIRANPEFLKDLQELLKDKGFYSLKVDGIWGQGTEKAIKEASEKFHLNNFDKQVIGKTFITRLSAYERKKEKEINTDPITEQDVINLAKELGLEYAIIQAVIDVESSGKWLQKDGKPIIRFESHVFSNFTDRIYDVSHPKISSRRFNPKLNSTTSEGEYLRFEIAKKLNETAALKSASYGAFQIMGFNHSIVGYSTVQDFFEAMHSPKLQLKAFGQFLVRNALIKTLRQKDWKGFAQSYNGTGYHLHRPPYNVRLERAYQKRAT